MPVVPTFQSALPSLTSAGQAVSAGRRWKNETSVGHPTRVCFSSRLDERTRARVLERGRVPLAVLLAEQLRATEEAIGAGADAAESSERGREGRADAGVVASKVRSVAVDRCKTFKPRVGSSQALGFVRRSRQLRTYESIQRSAPPTCRAACEHQCRAAWACQCSRAGTCRQRRRQRR